MQQEVKLFEMPENILFSLKEVTYVPAVPRMKEAFVVKGKVELFGIPFLAPIWVIAKVTYPEKWWEEIIPIIGSPTVGEGQLTIGGNFKIAFSRGFDREGEFSLDVEVHAGPTYTLDSITLPPFPPMAKEETTFIVGGELPPEELGFRNFRIISYSKNGGTPITPPAVLNLNVGDRCRVNLGCDHMDGAVTPKIHAAIGNIHTTPTEWFDEVLFAEKTFGIPASADWVPWIGYVDIIITSAISPGTYSLYAKIMAITGGDIFTPDYSKVITIAGAPPAEADIQNFDFTLTKGTYAVGAKVPFTAPYEYKGPAQNGQLTILIGTGAYPTFNIVYTYTPISVVFAAAADWATRSLQGNITLPSVLQAGQTYSVRAKLETLTAPTQETDTDWSAFDIAAGPPTSDIQNFDFLPQGGTYDLGDSVPYTAPYEYKGKAQSGTLTISLGTGVAFTTKYTFPSKSVTFKESMDWTPDTLSGSFVLPSTLEAGQTYSVRAQLKTADGKQETDTDWSVLTTRQVYKGTISKKELEYNQTRGVIPVSNVPQGKRGLVHIWGRNDTSSYQTLGIGWRVTDPNGQEVERHENDWASGLVGAGQDREFIGGRFDFNKLGTYRIAVALYMNSADPVEVARYEGSLCTVVAVAVAISFYVRPMGITSDCPNPKAWTCYYWDPGRSDFVGDGNWHNLPDTRKFDNVRPGGYLSAFYLDYSGAVSREYYSDIFSPVNGVTYVFELSSGRVYQA